MIVCSCNVLSDTQILSLPRAAGAMRPCSPSRAYRGLGCAPRCGRCVPTIRALLAEAHVANCDAACGDCPAEGATAERRNPAGAGDEDQTIYLMAAE